MPEIMKPDRDAEIHAATGKHAETLIEQISSFRGVSLIHIVTSLSHP